jgi:hypothetical protein
MRKRVVAIAGAVLVGVAAFAIGAKPIYAPKNTVLPAITGVAEVGEQISCSNGTWTRSPTGYSLRFEHVDDSSLLSTTTPYSIQSSDVGESIQCRVSATKGTTTGTAVSAAVGPVPSEGGGGPEEANVWLMNGTGACTRQATPVTFAASTSPDARCGTMQAAYDASTTGDTILVVDDGGAYAADAILRSSESQAGPMRYFREADGEDWVVNGGWIWGVDNGSSSGNPPSYVTYDGVTVNGSISCIWGSGLTTDITIKNAWIYDRTNAGDLISCGDSTNFTVEDTIIGPACCRGVGIGQGKSNSGSPGNNNHLYQDLTIYGLWDTCAGTGSADDWPTEYGSCTGTGFGDGLDVRHIDGIQLVDCDNCTVDRVTIYRLLGASSQGLFVHSNNGGTFQNFTVKNTMISGTRQGGMIIDGEGGTVSGTLTVAYNSMTGSGSQFTLGYQTVVAGTSVIVVGNIGGDMAAQDAAFNYTCTITASNNSTVTPTIWANLNGGRTCYSDENGTASFVNASPPFNLHLNSASNGINEGETTYCGAGKVVAVDIDGTARPLGAACDRGADEKE